jgi:phosphoglycolate phosphatase-like HAD superfamily hydrolase
MYKTIIFRLEGIVLNEEILRFKIYELLWYYLRRYPEFEEFKQLLALKNRYSSKKMMTSPYIRIMQNHLTERDQERFRHETHIIEKKLGNRYVRKVPGMRSIIQNLRYYYHIVFLARDSAVTRNAVWKFQWEDYTRFLPSGDSTLNPASFKESLMQIMKETRANPNETIVVSEYQFPDIQSARQVGSTTITTDYSLRIKGFTPQSFREREYVSSIEGEDVTNPFQIFRNPPEPANMIKSPQELVKKLESLEENQPSKPQYEQENTPDSLWDLAKKILNPPLEPPED